MFTIENHVGHLIELRMTSPITLIELAGFHAALTQGSRHVSGKIALCTDLLGARVFDQAVTTKLTNIIRQESPRVERNAFLVGEAAIFSMQIERIIRESGAPNRRTFRSSMDLVPWLGEVLSAPERKRLAAFLREGERLRAEEP
jgi:hypothetical protein